jgi:hypothetical protein
LCLSLPPLEEEEEDNFLQQDEKEYLYHIDQSLVEASLDAANRPDRKVIKSSHLGSDVDPITLVVSSAASAAVDMAKHITARPRGVCGAP